MNIADLGEKCKSLVERARAAKAGLPRDILIFAIIILASLLSFGLGYLAGTDTNTNSAVHLEAQ